ncbi:MAG: UDP-N-acetylmuramate dehydrogenase [Hydrogenibacillus sp.]|nr:UDP-N-acetylmuramate dehydrogenase [Hydrogenibacillus sp.]
MRDWMRRLIELDVGRVERDASMKSLTTWEIGGPADVLVVPRDMPSLVRLMQFLFSAGVPWFVLGKGSNLLVRDGGLRGVVIRLGEAFQHKTVNGRSVEVGAAYSLVRLAAETARIGLSGLEFAGGIPGSIGGAVFMNAGAHGKSIQAVLESAEIVWADGRTERLSASELDFAYRTSVLQARPGIVTRAFFRLTEGDPERIRERMMGLKAYRLRTQPLKERCAGSVFRNPPGDFAARLIEACGLKGARIGGAQVSPMHANFIVNTGDARAQDVLRLIEEIRRCVRERFGYALETEVRVVGEG